MAVLSDCLDASELREFHLFSFQTALLFFSFSRRFSLGGRFLTYLRAKGAPRDWAAAACCPLQQKFNCSSPSQVSRVSLAHLLSCTHLLYKLRRLANGWKGWCVAGFGELFVLPAVGCLPPLPATSAQEGAMWSTLQTQPLLTRGGDSMKV